MNTIKLNCIGERKAKGNKRGTGGMQYFDCLADFLLGREHDSYLASYVKLGDFATGDVVIAPEAYIDSETALYIATAFDLSDKRIYRDGFWVDTKRFYEEAEGFDFNTHPQISEKEFYHIPKRETVLLKNEKDIESLFEKFYALFKRYNFEVLELPLTAWARSLYVNCEGVGNASSEDVFSLEPSVDHAADIARISFGTFYLERLIMHETGDTHYSFNIN